MLVGVKGQTFRRIACLRRDIRRFRENQGCAGNGKLAQVHEVPIPRDPCIRRELSHGLDDYAVLQLYSSKLERLE